ncbi:hypothetical protein [Streptomyces triculaminicus]|uniref:hypothetical protein n=1 Tax=Streptomyces triculaminicus TaxID=2816232 RepID=UPI0037D2746F
MRGLCSPFGIGAVDQVVLASQRSRHWCLRLFRLANKAVVIDEAHGYQLFQQRPLQDVIAWLADASTSVVPLPHTIRTALIDACAAPRGLRPFVFTGALAVSIAAS